MASKIPAKDYLIHRPMFSKISVPACTNDLEFTASSDPLRQKSTEMLIRNGHSLRLWGHSQVTLDALDLVATKIALISQVTFHASVSCLEKFQHGVHVRFFVAKGRLSREEH